jgi:hypothetical protein
MGGVAGIAYFLGPRTGSDRSDKESRATSVATIIHDAFFQQHGDVHLDGGHEALQILDWFSKIRYPKEFLVEMPSSRMATTELLQICCYSKGPNATRSDITDRVFDRVLAVAPSLQELCLGVNHSDARQLLDLLLGVFDVTVPPLLSSWLHINCELKDSGRLAMVQDLGSGKGSLLAKVLRIGEDIRSEKKMVKDSQGSFMSPGATDAFQSGASRESLSSLRKDPAVSRLAAELARLSPGVDDTQILELYMTSRLGGVVRYAAGCIDTTQMAGVNEVFLTHSSAKMHTFSESHLEPMARYLALFVTKPEHIATPRIKQFTFSVKFVKQLLLGQWQDIDWGMRLLEDVREFRAGRGRHRDLDSSRPPSAWYKDLQELDDMVEPFCRLMMALGFRESDVVERENSPTALIGQVRDTFEFIRRNPLCRADVEEANDIFVHQAFKEAGGAWLKFFGTKAAHAPFPDTWLPLSSECQASVVVAKHAALTLGDWAAALPEACANMGMIKRPASSSGARPAGKKIKPSGTLPPLSALLYA